MDVIGVKESETELSEVCEKLMLDVLKYDKKFEESMEKNINEI